MKVPFRRIGADPQSFSLEAEGMQMEGTLTRHGNGLVLMKAVLKGKMAVDCFRCGESFDIIPDETVEILISDGIFHGQDETYDVVEMHEGVIDLDEVFASEIAMIKSDYHACSQCK